MKDEIKEILKCLEMDMLDNKQIEKLLDYITNLQEENEKLVKLKERYQLEKEVYKLRNEKAIEYMSNYIEVEDAPINERIKTEFKEVIRLLTGGDK